MPITQQPVTHYPISLLDVGDSFFIPALSAQQHIRKMRKLAAELGFEIDYRTGVDIATGMYGIRVIRIK